MEESDEFKWALKVVIKRQMRDLIEQLRENGEEIAIISADLTEEQCTHFGSPKGEWFMSEQRNLTSSFLKFCKHKTSKDTESVPKKPPAEAGAHGSASSYKLPSGMMSPRVVMEKLDGGPEDHDRCLMRVWVPADVIFAPGIADTDIVAVFGQLLTSRLSGAGQDAGDSPVKAGRGTKKTRSGRTVSSSFSDAVGTLTRRGRRQTQQNADASELSQEVIKKFEYSTVTGEPVDVEAGHSVDADQLQALTDAINPALDNLVSTNKLAGVKDKPVKVIVGKSCLRSEVQIEVENRQSQDEPTMSVDHEPLGLDMEVSDGDDFEDAPYEDKHVDFSAVMKSAIIANGEQNSTVSTDLESNKKVTTEVVKTKTKRSKPIVRNKAKTTKDKTQSSKVTRIVVKKKKRVYERLECELCGTQLWGSNNLKSHINRVHNKIRNHKCPVCPKEFWARAGLESHTISVHTRKCEACFEYVVESVPWEDWMTSSTVRMIECRCGGTVKVRSKRGVPPKHARSEAGQSEEDNEEEEVEEEQEKRPSKRNNNKNKMYACGVCGQLYTCRSHCKRHALKHSSTKGLVCDICGVAMKSQLTLNKHMATKHGVYKHGCQICSINCNSALALKKHMSKAHPRRKADTENQTLLVPNDNDTVQEGVDTVQQTIDTIVQSTGDFDSINSYDRHFLTATSMQ